MHIPRCSGMDRLSVAVIGAGPGGICMGAGLRMAGVERFTIYEKSSGIGGTWFENVYPGAEVDTPQPFYSFTFSSYDFSRTHVRQAELLAYLENTADRFHLRDHVRLSCRVNRVEWDPQDCTYVVSAQDGTSERYDVVVSAVGLLNNPRYPNWPGLDEFEGVKFHSSRWDDGCDLTDKVVAVVGTGSSGAQIVPGVAPKVKQLYLYQRQPGWVLPKADRACTPAERARALNPVVRRLTWWRQYIGYERKLRANFSDGAANVEAHEACLKYIDTVFADRPDLAKLVTPDYKFGAKRPVFDTNFYPTLLRDNVELVPHAVTRLTPTGIVDATGAETKIDVLIMCTGFNAPQYLAGLEVVGRDGRTLHEYWNGEPHALLGLMVPNFPNFYMLYGPNTNGSPIMFVHERQVEFVLRNLARMVKRSVKALEVRDDVEQIFNTILQRRLSKKIVSQARVSNYAFTESGREVIGWGEPMSVYWALTWLLRPLACDVVEPA